MSEILKPCPFCGAMPIGHDDRYMCSTPGCVMQEDTISAENWNTRPIEDDLRNSIDKLTAENKVLEDVCEILRKENKRLFSKVFSNAYRKECEE